MVVKSYLALFDVSVLRSRSFTLHAFLYVRYCRDTLLREARGLRCISDSMKAAGVGPHRMNDIVWCKLTSACLRHTLESRALCVK